jgi:hypothetical protein
MRSLWPQYVSNTCGKTKPAFKHPATTDISPKKYNTLATQKARMPWHLDPRRNVFRQLQASHEQLRKNKSNKKHEKQQQRAPNVTSCCSRSQADAT